MTKKVYTGKEGEEAGIQLQQELKRQANATVNSAGFNQERSSEDQSIVAVGLDK